jgi:hypothetical protein
MATTPNYGWVTPEQTTSPPDVVYWMDSLAADADADLKATETTATTRILHGTEANLPGTLEPGQLYAAYEA